MYIDRFLTGYKESLIHENALFLRALLMLLYPFSLVKEQGAIAATPNVYLTNCPSRLTMVQWLRFILNPELSVVQAHVCK